jgi:Leucine-rich repeat (LRR) protein
MWLPKHAALVNSITANIEYCDKYDTHWLYSDSQVDEVQCVLHQALQLAGTMPASPAALASATAAVSDGLGGNTAAQQHQLQQGWRLASYSSDMLRAELLAALPAHSLTRLDLYPGISCTRSGEDYSTIAAALARLISLQHLNLVLSTGGIPGSDLAGVAQLSRLTALTLRGNATGMSQPLEQLLAQQLPLRKLDIGMQDDTSSLPPPVLDFKHLTTLEELSSRWSPARSSPVQCSTVMPLEQLQRLDLVIATDTAGELACLARLPALQHLALRYNSLGVAAATAHVWSQLPQLQALLVDDDDKRGTTTKLQMHSMLAGIAAATSLTHLHLHSFSLVDVHTWPCVMADIVVWPKLAGLLRLQELHIQSPLSGPSPDDMRALKALTGLTHLDLTHSWNLATDSAIVLARSLTRLRHLDLDCCNEVDLSSTELMLALGQLTQLTFLNISLLGDNELTVNGLMQLTGLCQLQKLRLIDSNEITEEVLRVFWEAVRAQQKESVLP